MRFSTISSGRPRLGGIAFGFLPDAEQQAHDHVGARRPDGNRRPPDDDGQNVGVDSLGTAITAIVF